MEEPPQSQTLHVFSYFADGGEVQCCQKKKNLLWQHPNSCVRVTACELESTESIADKGSVLGCGQQIWHMDAILRFVPISKVLQM